MWANNEVGTVQPVAELAAVARGHGVPFHTDAVQASASCPSTSRPAALDAHDGHRPQDRRPARRRRCCCSAASRRPRPGAARRRPGARRPLRHPGHPGDRRAGRGRARSPSSGSRSAPSGWPGCATTWCAGCARSCRTPCSAATRDLSPTHRLPGNAHFSFPGCEGDALLLLLDARGIECSTGSACSAGVPQPSHVLLAMGVPEALARGSLRFSLGHTSTAGRRRRGRRGHRPGGRAGPPGRPERRRMTASARSDRDEGARRDVRRRRLRGRRRPRGRGRPRRHRRAPGAVEQPAVVPHRRPRLLHPRGRPRRPPGGRRDRHPVLRLGPRRAVPRGRRRRLRRRVRRRPHAQPVPALQREDQVLGGARQGARARLRRGLHRPLRAASSRRPRCTARSTRPRTSPTCSAC